MDTLKHLVPSATQSCTSLLLTASGLPNERTISDLQQQLQALDTALGFLQNNMSETGDEFAALFLPVKACHSVCTDLNEEIKQASSAGLQDWTSLKCRGANIAGLTNKLKLYTTTIVIKTIAVGSSSGTFTLAPSFLHTYRDLIEETQWGLLSDMKNTLDEFEQREQDRADGDICS
ncbi:hypothetical protein BKA64DRAFT_766030 [Cadophora sp. MPI-SDFR-AT-0126]|nr:hypothetical protein BKA64DRAFT_766030 [Leotiomycetes sp. MPI-SDFR-AT-0126]